MCPAIAKGKEFKKKLLKKSSRNAVVSDAHIA